MCAQDEISTDPSIIKDGKKLGKVIVTGHGSMNEIPPHFILVKGTTGGELYQDPHSKMFYTKQGWKELQEANKDWEKIEKKYWYGRESI